MSQQLVRNLLVIALLTLTALPTLTGYLKEYDEKKKIAGSCSGVATNTPLTIEDVNRWRLWPGLISDADMSTGETLSGFKEAMAVIWKHQHPEDCSQSKFLISEGWPQGFGSEVHIQGNGLAFAMNMGRIYVMNPEGPLSDKQLGLNNTYQTNSKFCIERGKVNLECYYEKWTSCSISEILGDKTIADLRASKAAYLSDSEIKEKQLRNSTERVILLKHRADVREEVPKVLRPILDCSSLGSSENNEISWWRSVSAAYVLRPSRATQALMDKHRKEVPIKYETEQCVSAYVRRGDKHVEGTFRDFRQYALAGRFLWDEGLLSSHRPTSSAVNGTLFLGSEDPSVIREAEAWGVATGWRVVYTKLFDRAGVSAGRNFTVQEQEKAQGVHTHHELEYFSMIYNLDLHLRCNAFVCTMSSNFCRVIDELRATVASKANKHLADVLCLTSVCIDAHTETGW